MQLEQTTRKLTIGSVSLDSCVFLAPMAGITDTVLRQLVRSYSPNCVLMSEMISSESLKYCNEKYLTDYAEAEFPLAFQLSGHKPDRMAEGAKKLEGISTFIDINMGCPAPKIVRNFDGSRLMTDLKLASEIITAVKQAVSIPVTVKCRLGWDHHSKNFVEFVKMAESSGADAIIIHGRTRSQMYSGKADWQAIAEAKKAVSIPLIGNGDITSPERAKEFMEISKCDGIAVGRGIFGDPELIARIEKYIYKEELVPPPDINTKVENALKHTQMEIDYRGEEAGIRYMRKFFAHYVRGIRNACKHRFDLVRCEKFSEVEQKFAEILGVNLSMS